MDLYEIRVGVDGMACPMCEAHVNDAVRSAFPRVRSVESSHKKKETLIVSDTRLPEDQVRSVIENSGYRFLSYACGPHQEKGLLAKLTGFLGRRNMNQGGF